MGLKERRESALAPGEAAQHRAALAKATGRRRLEAVFAAYPHQPDSNQVSASWEVVYASAFAGGRTTGGPQEFSVDAAQLTNSLAARRERPAPP